MQAKKENYWYMLRLLLLMNVVLIGTIVLMSSTFKHSEKKDKPCTNTKKINTDILNSVTIKLM